MSPLHHQIPVGSIPTRRLRACNASLASIEAGLKAVAVGYDDAGKTYLRFRNGQLRRLPGQGHSRLERAMRRDLRAGRRSALIDPLP